jgi:2-hydroxy-3-oxopropionate reductase
VSSVPLRGRDGGPGPEAIGFIGLGRMGGRMAARLLAAGHRLVVFDTRPEAVAALQERGAQAGESPAGIAERAAVCLLSLPTPDVVETVVTGSGGLIEGRTMRTCVDLSTTGPLLARDIGRRLHDAGVAFLDAPVSGGVSGADAGTLAVMAAGAPSTLASVSPLLETFAGAVFHVGYHAGMGQLAKVLNNMLSATALAATAEVMALGVKNGLEAPTLLDVLNASTGHNSATAEKFPRAVLPRSFDVGFALALMNKDVQICLEEAKRAELPLPVATAVATRWAQAADWATPGADCTEIVRLVEMETGSTIGDGGPLAH